MLGSGSPSTLTTMQGFAPTTWTVGKTLKIGVPDDDTYWFTLNGRLLELTGEVNSTAARDGALATINAIETETGIAAVASGDGIELIAAEGRHIALLGDYWEAQYFGLGDLMNSNSFASTIRITSAIPAKVGGTIVFNGTEMGNESFTLQAWTRIAPVDLTTVEGSALR